MTEQNQTPTPETKPTHQPVPKLGAVLTILLTILAIALITPLWVFAPLGVAITTTILVAVGLVFYIRSLATQNTTRPW